MGELHSLDIDIDYNNKVTLDSLNKMNLKRAESYFKIIYKKACIDMKTEMQILMEKKNKTYF